MTLKNNIITFLSYTLFTLLIVKTVIFPNQILLVWPAVGIGIVVTLAWGRSVLPALYLAQLFLNILFSSHELNELTFDDLLFIHSYIFIGIFRCYLGAFLIRYYIGYPSSYITYQSVIKLIAIGLVTPFMTSILYILSNIYFDISKSNSFLSDTLNWWLGDVLGFIIFVPLTLIFISQPRQVWKPRIFTVAIPILLIFSSVLFIYNKSVLIDNQRSFDNFKLKNQIVVNTINAYNSQFSKIIQSISTHKLTSLDSQFNQYFNSEMGKYGLIESISIMKNGTIKNYPINSSKNNKERIILNNYIKKSKFTNEKSPLFKEPKSTNYIKILRFDLYEGTVYAFISINFTKIKKILLLNDLKNTHAHLTSTFSNNIIKVNDELDENHYNYSSTSALFLFDESFNLTLVPTNQYFLGQESNLNSIIATIGFLFTGLVTLMLLIITGKTIYTKIKVKEKTLELDQKLSEFKESKQNYRNLIEQHPIVLWRQNITNSKMTYISKKVEKILGYSLNDWLKSENFWLNHIHDNDKDYVSQKIAQSINLNKSFELEYRFHKANGEIAYIKDIVNIDKEGSTQLIGLMIDDTVTKKALKKQVTSENKYRTLFKYAVDPIIIIDLENKNILDFNKKALKLFSLEDVKKGYTLNDFSTEFQADGSSSKKKLSKIYKKIVKKTTISFEWLMLKPNKEEIICKIEFVKLPTDNRNILLASISDITDIKNHERKITQLAYYDNLTKIPNREYFYSKFEYFHQLAIDTSVYGTVIYLDLDRFKLLNDSLGHQAGDELLKMVAQRIKAAARKNDICARLAGDEFIILTKNFHPNMEAALESSFIKAELILESLNNPYQLGNYEHYITPSIGISLFPETNKTIDQIVHQADIAMYVSKDRGKNTITIYQEDMVKFVNKHLEIENAIKQAFVNNEFLLHYQPQVDCNGNTVAAEALLRWKQSKKYAINTENLVDTIEKIGLIHELGYWIFDHACYQLKQWEKEGNALQSIAINVSAKQFKQKLFVDQIKSIILSNKVNPSQIIIELTEAILVEDIYSLTTKLKSLRDYGIQISLDDFGTGYSSLAYLKMLPINQLKIDKMFVNDLYTNASAQKVVKTIINLANSLKIDLVAEGIENKEQFEILKNLGCNKFQGFYFSKALPSEDLF